MYGMVIIDLVEMIDLSLNEWDSSLHTCYGILTATFQSLFLVSQQADVKSQMGQIEASKSLLKAAIEALGG